MCDVTLSKPSSNCMVGSELWLSDPGPNAKQANWQKEY
jgi:hypothetical protein